MLNVGIISSLPNSQKFFCQKICAAYPAQKLIKSLNCLFNGWLEWVPRTVDYELLTVTHKIIEICAALWRQNVQNVGCFHLPLTLMVVGILQPVTSYFYKRLKQEFHFVHNSYSPKAAFTHTHTHTYVRAFLKHTQILCTLSS